MPTPIHDAMESAKNDKFDQKPGPERLKKIDFLLGKYGKWLAKEHFVEAELSEREQKSWLDDVAKIQASVESGDPAVMWEAVCDHWLETEWDEDDMPDALGRLYDEIDSLRADYGIDSSSQTGVANAKED